MLNTIYLVTNRVEAQDFAKLKNIFLFPLPVVFNWWRLRECCSAADIMLKWNKNGILECLSITLYKPGRDRDLEYLDALIHSVWPLWSFLSFAVRQQETRMWPCNSVLSEEKHGQAGCISLILSSTGQIYTSQTDYIFGDITLERLKSSSLLLLVVAFWTGATGKAVERHLK